MATGGLYGSSTANISVASSGAESNGLYGNNTNFGGTYFEWFVFQVAASQPATPTGGSWDFTTNVGTAPSGWLNAPPSNPTNPVWVSIGIVNSRSTSSITWSTPGVFSYSGQLNGSAVPTSGTGLDGEFYIQTGVSPYAIWFKNTGTWVQVTGAALYVALTGDQTIGGTKTFSSLIQGSISGNAATATSATTAAYATTAGSATTAGTATYATSAGSVPYSGLTGTVPTWNQNTTGNAATADYATNAGFATNANSAVFAGNVTGIVAIANGGTGASDATTARTNLGLGTAAVRNAGVALGVATLDAGGTVPLSQIPASIQGGVSYQGTWNATSNSPTLTSSVGTKGYYYVVNVAGSTNLNGITDWLVGDWAIFNGTTWEKIDNTDAVTSVNGYTGTVVLTQPDIAGTASLTTVQTLTNKTLTSPVINAIFDTNGNKIIGLSPTASATDYLTVKNGIGVGVPLHVYADGSSSNIGLHVQPKGSGLVTISDGTDFNKGIRFRSSGSSASAITLLDAVSTAGRVVTLPDATTTLVGRDTTDTLTNKTLTNSIVNTPSLSGGTIDNTVIGGTTPAAGTFTTLTATGQTSLGGVAGSESLRVLVPATAGGFIQAQTTSSTQAVLQIAGSANDYNLAFSAKGTGNLRFFTNAATAEQFRVANTASAVNYVQVTGGATGGGVVVSAQGSDAAVNLALQAKSGGIIRFLTGNGTDNFRVNSVSSTANYLAVGGAGASSAPYLAAQGTDTNISQVFQSKGTGAIDLAAGSSGVNISNGGTVTAVTRTAGGTGYATAPTVTISAPTTAGGVQATATCTVTAGVVDTTFTITNAGSGYVEQPTVTFSGGGGSGAAAYATVGSVTTIKSLGSSTTGSTLASIQFVTPNTASPNYPPLTIRDIGGADTGILISPNIGYTQLLANTATNSTLMLASAGTNAIYFNTQGVSQTNQMRVAHTASAVNYVQVTGSATGSAAQISAQGSDSTIALQFNSKATTGQHIFTAGSTNAFRVLPVASAVNYPTVSSAVTGSGAVFGVAGTDTNIDLTLTPKGTGRVQFGTYTANMALTVQGYIEIKDSGGTVRKLAVIA